jgi:hypothetical protein
MEREGCDLMLAVENSALTSAFLQAGSPLFDERSRTSILKKWPRNSYQNLDSKNHQKLLKKQAVLAVESPLLYA